ncbi:MAG: hypothetical protein WCT49_01645 [Candidatus Paceibacterota bacterium]|jgi:hypothetical protein|nr:hypothetical protein [Candidatus Paceibacterota bacterium]
MTLENEILTPKDFYYVLEGDGVCENEILLGTAVRLTFHIPALDIKEQDRSFGLSVRPYGLHYVDTAECYKRSYKEIHLPCKETSVGFSFVAPTEAEWKNTITPGFVFVLDMNGSVNYQDFLKVRFVSERKPYKRKLEIDLENHIKGIVKSAIRGEIL